MRFESASRPHENPSGEMWAITRMTPWRLKYRRKRKKKYLAHLVNARATARKKAAAQPGLFFASNNTNKNRPKWTSVLRTLKRPSLNRSDVFPRDAENAFGREHVERRKKEGGKRQREPFKKLIMKRSARKDKLRERNGVYSLHIVEIAPPPNSYSGMGYTPCATRMRTHQSYWMPNK